MEFKEWKEGFSEKCNNVVEAHADMHDFLEIIKNNDGFDEIDEDEFLAFFIMKSLKMDKAIKALG